MNAQIIKGLLPTYLTLATLAIFVAPLQAVEVESEQKIAGPTPYAIIQSADGGQEKLSADEVKKVKLSTLLQKISTKACHRAVLSAQVHRKNLSL
jgi:hypothetical protein